MTAAAPEFFFPDVPELPLPDGHRFPNTKYRLLRELVAHERLLGGASLGPSPPATRDTLLHAHAATYVDAVLAGNLTRDEQRRIGLPWSETLVRRSLATVGGSLAAARSALATGISGQLAGGTHHAHRAFGSGFCVFNDLAVASLAMIAEGVARRIAILDLDVHQGDGNAAILAPESAVFVASIHGDKNFPFRKAISDLDIALPDRTEGPAYMAALAGALDAVSAFRPDVVLYLSGADALAEDRLGRLSLTLADLAARDRLVFETFRRQGVPVSIAIGGGYAQPIRQSVEAYAQTFRAARAAHGF